MGYISEKGVDLHLTGTSKEEVLSELVAVLVKNGTIRRGQPLLDTLMEREGLGSTGIGFGVAIPHGRCEELTQPAIIFGRTQQEVDFDSIDGNPTRIFFLLVAPESGGNEHLHLMAKIARLMKDADTRQKLLDSKSPSEVVQLFGDQTPS